MGIVPGTFNTATCTRLLLWFALLLSSRLTPTLMPLFCTELTATEVTLLPPTLASMVAMLPPTPTATPLDTPEPADTLPTLPVLSMLPRGPLMPSPRLMPMLLFCTELMDTVVLATPDMAMVPTPMEDTPMVATPMPMELTTERGPLTPSPRLMPMLTMAVMAMVSTPMEVMPMVATPMPTELMLTESKLLSQSLVVKLLQTKAQK